MANTPPFESTSTVLEFHPSEAIVERVSKFGGQPVWVAAATWPVSKKTGKPMQFIAQLKIAEGQMAYLFMTDVKEEYVDGTYLAEGGENAVIVQPGNIPSFVKVIPAKTGPSLRQEFKLNYSTLVEPFSSYSGFKTFIRSFPEQAQEQYYKTYGRTKIGGTPIYIQDEETPKGKGWEFLLQINSKDVPFYINFGDAGKAFIFLNKDLNEGRMLWQCS